MKRFFLFPALSLLAVFAPKQIEAQQNNGTHEDGFLLKLFLPDGSTPLFEGKKGGYGYALFGGEVLEEMEGEVAWARTAAGDSICCAPVVNDLAGKIALIRRGENCGFSQKIFYAQQMGAKVAIIVNHYSWGDDDENTVAFMSGGVNADSVVIPCIFICRKVGELITSAIDNGQPLTARFVFRSLDKATAAYHYATPLSQVDTLKHITAHFFNPTSDTIFNAVVRADITEPDGNAVTLSVPVASLAPRQDTLLFFPHYLPAFTIGDFEVLYTNNIFGDIEDVMRQKFRVTAYTWASDNQDILPNGFLYDYPDFSLSRFQPGALYRTGPNGGVAAQAIFGLVDADKLDIWEYGVGVVLYDADIDNNDAIDFPGGGSNNWTDLNPIGWGNYELTGNEVDNELIAIPIKDINSNLDTVLLKPRHWYYLTLLFEDFGDQYNLATLSATPKQHYFDFPSSPVSVAYYTFCSEVSTEATIVQRLASENNAIEPLASQIKNLALPPSQFTLFPNPANDFLQLGLRLSAANQKIAATLLDWQGRVVATERRSDFQEGGISFEVQNLPSGAYLLWIRTDEGSAIRKVMICH